MPDLLRIGREIRAKDSRCQALEICAGFPWSDVEFAGPSIVMTWTGPDAPKEAMVAPLLSQIWSTRNESSAKYISVQEACALAKAWKGDKPLILADVADNPGAGGYGDSVSILRALLEADVSQAAVAAIADPNSVARAIAAGPGAQIRLSLGGRFEPERYGGPLECEARVLRVSDGALRLTGPMMTGVQMSMGPTVVLQVQEVCVVVVTNNTQVFDRSVFISQGIDPLLQQVLVVKSSHHFRSDFGPIAGRIALVDAGGSVSPDIRRLRYEKVRRPIEPLDNLHQYLSCLSLH